MDEATEKTVMGFVRWLAELCKDCHRRNSYDCLQCPATEAQRLMVLANPPALTEDPTMKAARLRRESIVKQLRDAKKPVRASEIWCGGCDPSTKTMTLARLRTLGEVRRIKIGRSYFYALPERKTNGTAD